MHRVLVTGANKGIGLALVEAILAREDSTFVYLGSRDLERGREAEARLVRDHSEWKGRIEVVALDVADDRSVRSASERVLAGLGGEKLHGVVNNAGIGSSSGDLRALLETNVRGIRRVCEAFLPLLDPARGRVVNVTSAAGPSFVATCSAERQRIFLDAQLSSTALEGLIEECLGMAGDERAFAAAGLGDGSPYGLSKALANTYTLILARENPALRVNACTPGFIATDMTRPHAEAQGKSPAEMGMKTPAEGTKAPMHLLFDELEGNGRYYGSDAVRSPLDRYRAPGSAPYAGS